MASRAPSERKRVPSAPHAFPLISPNPPHCLRVGCRSAASRDTACEAPDHEPKSERLHGHREGFVVLN